MKLKNFSLAILLIFAFSFVGFSQVDDEEAQMFGSKRNIQTFDKYDFGTITEDVVSHEFTIKNPSLIELTISEFTIPDGFGIILADKVIAPQSEGKFIVTVNKEFMDGEGKFNEKIIVKTTQKKPMGVTVTTESVYSIKGTY